MPSLPAIEGAVCAPTALSSPTHPHCCTFRFSLTALNPKPTSNMIRREFHPVVSRFRRFNQSKPRASQYRAAHPRRLRVCPRLTPDLRCSRSSQRGSAAALQYRCSITLSASYRIREVIPGRGRWAASSPTTSRNPTAKAGLKAHQIPFSRTALPFWGQIDPNSN